MTVEEQTDWIAFIRDVYKHATSIGKHERRPVFHSPAELRAIIKCEKRLNVTFPTPLKNLLLQTNGVSELLTTTNKEIDTGYFLYSIEGILEINSSLRSQDFNMPLDCLLFFAGDGMGDYFGFAVVKGKVPHSRIYFWDHEDDSRQSIAPSLGYFIENWKLGKIRV